MIGEASPLITLMVREKKITVIGTLKWSQNQYYLYGSSILVHFLLMARRAHESYDLPLSTLILKKKL